jgi:pimeloyl-ACP methyl ester carboxylesterase
VDNPPLAPVPVGGVPSTVRQGVHAHAAYDVEVPPHWNGDLVMWAHGYRGQGFVLTVDPPGYGLRQKLLDQGYAWAASSYYDNGYDIRAGVLSTHDLAELFGSTVHRPHRTYIAGVSMGGHIIGRSVEQYPDFYAGALPMCGVLGDHDLFDFFLDYNVVAQDLAGVPAWPVPADYLTNAVPRIEVATGLAGLKPGGPDTTNDLGKQLRAITINRSGGPRPGAEAAFPVWKDFLFGLAVPSGGTSLAQDPGQLATNLFTRYQPNAPVDVNRTVRRVPARDWRDRFNPRLTQVPVISGVPTAPVLSLHGLGDMFVPFSMEQDYAADVARHHRRHAVIQRAIRSAGHCEFSPTEVGTAWDDLTRWVRNGIRPGGDDIADPRAVAAATFGCRFSDQAAYAAGSGTRRLFAACP